MKKKIILLALFMLLSQLSVFQKKDEESQLKIQSQFLARITFDLFYKDQKVNVFDLYHMTLEEGLNFFLEKLNKLHDNPQLYKKYQDTLRDIITNELK